MGSPAEVADQLRPWITGGTTYIAPSDLASAVFDVDDQEAVLARNVELARCVRSADAGADGGR
ncbi:hypothetical protein [Mycobacterium sherrisii]|uniref:hypothetical protein n=1 Tax=Mycobacterium sherrisii TaxID=243061 RepID=UPI000A1481EF|nr:hypothetical protein [Mycobacterium sherrisii]MCV7032534.1 hypothetical protein [Mycobacterium sherrisii]ORW74193.1 hypothetical protein AWC25_00430 [Mycobacterium sherrisii]